MPILEGQRFGRLVAFRISHKDIHGPYWFCICDCGKEVVIRGDSLTRGHTKSCGCLKVDMAIETHTTHGQAKKGKQSKEYLCWLGMKRRCYDSVHKHYKHYGGRGIKVCERWLESFENFYEDMGDCPLGLSLDRKDNDGDYTPENCRWATWEEQHSNKRNNRWIDYGGDSKTLTQWSRYLNINSHTLYNRLRRGWGLERSFTESVRV